MNWFRKWKLKKNSHSFPEFIRNYLCSMEGMQGRIPLQELNFVTLDTETTSLDIKNARLLSIGAISGQWNSINIHSSFHCFLNWKDSSKPENIHIHGITPRQSEMGSTPNQAIEKFLNYISGSVLVAHHAAFDLAVINRLIGDLYPGLAIQNPILDTVSLTKRLEKSGYDILGSAPSEYSLDSVAERYGVTPLERHTALGDAYTTALVFVKLVSRLKKRGIKDLKDLL